MRGDFTMVVLCSALLFSAGPASAQVRASTGQAVKALPSQIHYGYNQDLLRLRRSALEQQRADGGRLSEEHAAQIQVRLDDVNRRYARALRNSDPLSVDSNGQKMAAGPSTTDWTQSNLFLTGR